MKEEFADLRSRTLSDRSVAEFRQARALVAAGIVCDHCTVKTAATVRGGRPLCRSCARADRILRKHRFEETR
jgi:hypothetical protein